MRSSSRGRSTSKVTGAPLLGETPPPVVELERLAPGPLQTTGTLRAGAARMDITPGFLTPLAGWGPSLPSRRMLATWGRLMARVLVLDDGHGERVALIAADLHAGTRYIAERLAQRTSPLGLHIGRLFFAGTHTHSGPGNFYGSTFYDAFAQSPGGLDDTLVNYLVERLERGVREACENLHPARVGHGVARLWGYSCNRSHSAFRHNFPNLDDTALRQKGELLGFPNGASFSPPSQLPIEQVCVDPRVQVLWADEAQPPYRPIGAFATFGVHATLVALSHPLCGPDLFGVATRHAESLLRGAEPGAEPILGLAAGAIGDADPALPGLTLEALKRERKNLSRDMELVEKAGRELGGRLFEACGEARSNVKTSLRITTLFDEPLIRNAVLKDGTRMPKTAIVGAPTLGGSELGGGVPCFQEGNRQKVPDSDPQWPKEPPLVLERLMRDSFKYQAPTLPLRLLKVGEVWMVGLPGEPTSWLAHRLEEEMRAQGALQVMVAGVCGDYSGYLTTEREYEAQHYEGSSTLWGRYTERWLVEHFQSLASKTSGSVPSGTARFTVKRGEHPELTEPAPHSDEPVPTWAISPEFEQPKQHDGRLVLEGRWFAWAPQEHHELGWGPWLQIENASTGQVMLSAGRPVDDQHHAFLLEFKNGPGFIEWRWSLTLDEWQHWDGLKVRFRPVGPRGIRVQPPPGSQWPEQLITMNATEEHLEAQSE
ncbi:neutral/alkaline non-lysosomal ceramidase N-terminal domain-containing protein [Vitiosangium sp. GDMCC 1.1324]|uniref:neutral/alkaline non-lysosomal ceramidase N-terminal domain-containing protein n=1 Tax=Vitiosangium sp. (strain GDMCC 1.1324) TaxID=2138576 RepID=UPI000D3571BD